MKLALDLMGGDHAPSAPIDGAAAALQADDRLELVLVGTQPALVAAHERLISHHQRVELLLATEVVSNDENPAMAVRRKKDSSLLVSMRKAAELGSGLVSCGPTGALMAAGLFVFGRLPGVRRPALGSPFPNLVNPDRPWFMLDIGANLEATAKDLLTYAIIGSLYCEMVLEVPQPRIGLLNVGVEPLKGTDLLREAHALLSTHQRLNFAGNVEARDIFGGQVDVVVCDGFAGNVLLKGMEGLTGSLAGVIKQELRSGARSRLGAALVRPYLRRAFARLDYAEQGGAPLFGLGGTCIKCHGSSGDRAIAQGLRVAGQFASRGVLQAMAESLAELPSKSP